MPLILPGMQLSHFRLKEKIGAGSFGEVYRAEDVYLQRPVALKLLTFTESHSIQERFLQEALRAAAVPTSVGFWGVAGGSGKRDGVVRRPAA